MIKASYSFPSAFLWGTATSSHQVEGGNNQNDWHLWEQEPGRILHGHTSGPACEWWSGRWAEDFDRAAKTHQNAHRLSIEWSRVEPSPALWDEQALDQYRDMIQGAIDRGLEPMVTLNHFTLPQWVAEKDGWLADESAIWFERYVRKIVGKLKDLVQLWVTFNEPNVLVYSGYISDEFPPGRKNLRIAPKAILNIVMAHAAAYHAIHEIDPMAKVGIAHHYRGFHPPEHAKWLDKLAARVKHRNFNVLFARAAQDGWIRFLTWQGQVPRARRTQDFFGLNYYTAEEVSFDILHPTRVLAPGGFSERAKVSPGEFIADVPQGLWEALKWAHSFNLPIYITENGVEDPDDGFRCRYLAHHLHQVWRAANFNWRIIGYFHWSLIDNFEWERGWTQRFGLWSLDENTQARRKRPSAEFYAEVCRSGELSSESVETYASEVFDDLFPPRGPSELLD